jgi:hypothetical protein
MSDIKNCDVFSEDTFNDSEVCKDCEFQEWIDEHAYEDLDPSINELK